MWPSRLWAQPSSGNARGWKSSGQPLASTVEACSPARLNATRLDETSNSAPPAILSASRVALKSIVGDCVRATINHDAGPSQNAVEPAARVVVLAASGSGTPNARVTLSTNDARAGSPCAFHAPAMVTSPSVSWDGSAP